MAKYKYYDGSNWVELLQSSDVLTYVTYSQLSTLKSNNQLVPGLYYRITDFVTTTAQARSRSAGHQFDIIVQAISTNELSEDASACLHSGDTYFANSNLKAWVLKYCFTNDTTRFAWADTANGKGVIYYMKDEFHNECGYDFKNIQFARYKVTACANCSGLVGKYIGVLNSSGSAILSSFMTLDTTDYRYHYTFDCLQTDYSMNAIGTTLTRPNGTTFTLNQIQCTKCMICPDESDSTKFYLNNFTILLESSRDCMFRVTGWCQNTTFMGGCSNFQMTNVYDSILGCWGSAAYIDGYTGGSSSVNVISRCLICCSGTSNAINCSIVGYVNNSCLVGGTNGVIGACRVTYVSACTLIGGSSVLYQSTIGSISGCNITCTSAIIHRSTVNLLASCNGQGATFYCQYATLGYFCQVSMYDTALAQPFIYYSTVEFMYASTFTKIAATRISSLMNSSFRTVAGCNFGFNQNLTCTQDLSGCNFGVGVNYLTFSSTTTSQVISNTNFHDIAGTSETTKTFVIPEDYSTIHTVEIYAKQHHIHEID